MNFYQAVYKITKQIPKGKVASYGQIAALITNVRAARAVGWCLHRMDNDRSVPWHRIINSKGYITTTCRNHNAGMQKKLLEKEGIKVVKKNNLWWIDIKQYLWQP